MIVWVDNAWEPKNPHRGEVIAINGIYDIKIKLFADDKILTVKASDIKGVELSVDKLPKVGDIITGNYLVVAVYDKCVWASRLLEDGNPVIVNGQISLTKFTLQELKEQLPNVTIWR